MSTISGTITGVSLLHGNPTGSGTRKTYLCTVDFAAYTGSSDSGQITTVAATISTFVRDGKTRALIADSVPFCVGPGSDTNAQAVYMGAATISSTSITFNLTDGAGTELTSTTAVTGVQIAVCVTES